MVLGIDVHRDNSALWPSVRVPDAQPTYLVHVSRVRGTFQIIDNQNTDNRPASIKSNTDSRCHGSSTILSHVEHHAKLAPKTKSRWSASPGRLPAPSACHRRTFEDLVQGRVLSCRYRSWPSRTDHALRVLQVAYAEFAIISIGSQSEYCWERREYTSRSLEYTPPNPVCPD